MQKKELNALKKEAAKVGKEIEKVKQEVSKVVVGQSKVVDGIIKGLISGGHILIEGVPGIAKTLIIRAVSVASGCSFKRIQFTADLLPTDIVGLTAYTEDKGFFVNKGPIFANFVLADEINRAPPKVQSATLEAMQERQVTIGKKTYGLPNPFFVLATENPIETLGIYALPEAQVDRFLFKLFMDYPNISEEFSILDSNITLRTFEEFPLKPVLDPRMLIKMQALTKRIYLSDDVKSYITKIVDATRAPLKYKINSGKHIQWAASPRASIGLYIASKASALMNGRGFVIPQDVKDIAHDVMRHRILLTHSGKSAGVRTDVIINEILNKIQVP